MNLPQRIRGEHALDTLVAAVPVGLAVALLALFIIPNYVRARQCQREVATLRAVADHSASRQDELRELQSRLQSLRQDVAKRGRRLPGSPDQGRLLESLAQSADMKGVSAHESRTGPIRRVPVPGLPGGMASRRTVDVDMQGSFETLFDAMRTAEALETLVTVRTVDMVRSPTAGAGEGVHTTFSFDEYFAASAGEETAAAKGGEARP
jgi:Tfp pilus assembly protein PilO